MEENYMYTHPIPGHATVTLNTRLNLYRTFDVRPSIVCFTLSLFHWNELN